MLELRHSTTSIVKIGPIVIATTTNILVPVTNLTIDGADEAELLKYGTTGTQAISGTLTAIANCDGWYNLTLTAAELSEKGLFTVIIQDDSACLPFYKDYMIVDSKYYDSKYSTTLWNVNIESISGDTAAADNCELSFDGTGYAGGTTLWKVDISSISGDTTSADNLELAYDGTGYAGGLILPKVDVDSVRTSTQTATDLKDLADTGYDPATHKIAGVVLVDTTSVNTDMRGTDNAALASVCTELRLAELDAANIPTDLSNINTKTTNLPASPAAVGSAMTLADDAITSAKFDETSAFPLTSADTVVRTGSVVEGTYTLIQWLKLVGAALFGKLSGGGTVTLKFRDTADTKDRLTVTVDANEDRTVVTTDVS